MRIILDLFGYVILLLGTTFGFMSGSVTLIVICLVGGLVLLALSHLISIAESLQARFLELPLTTALVRKSIMSATAQVVASRSIELKPSENPSYALIELEGNAYMRTHAFTNYLSVTDNRYTFAFPDRPPIELHCADGYFKGSELFAIDGYAYVMLRAIGLDALRENGRILIEQRPAASDATTA